MRPPHPRPVHCRHGRHVRPDRRDPHLLLRRHPEGVAQIGGVLGQGAEDGGEVLHQPLLPGPRDPIGRPARNPADLVMVVGEEVPDEQQAMGDPGAPHHPDQGCDGDGGRPGDEGVEAVQVEMLARHTGGMPACQDELAGVADEAAQAVQLAGRAAHHPDAVPDPGWGRLGARRSVPVEMQHLDLMAGVNERPRQFGGQIRAPGLGRKLHAGHQNAHGGAPQASFQTLRRT